MGPQYDNLKEIFLAAVERRSPAERKAFLDEACAGNAALREGVDALLASVAAVFDEAKTTTTLTLPFADGRARAALHADGIVGSETQSEDGWQITVTWTARQERRWRSL